MIVNVIMQELYCIMYDLHFRIHASFFTVVCGVTVSVSVSVSVFVSLCVCVCVCVCVCAYERHRRRQGHVTFECDMSLVNGTCHI